MPTDAVCDGAKSHEFSELTILRRPENKVEMVRHQAVSEHIDWDAIVRFGEGLQKHAVLVTMLKELEAPRAPVHHMKNEAACSRHRSSWHGWPMFKILARKAK